MIILFEKLIKIKLVEQIMQKLCKNTNTWYR